MSRKNNKNVFSDVHMFHCTQELEMPLTKCGVVMMATDPDDIWLNEQCEFGDEESGEILAELIEHYHGNEEGLCKCVCV